jgi:hypothetical protein
MTTNTKNLLKYWITDTGSLNDFEYGIYEFNNTLVTFTSNSFVDLTFTAIKNLPINEINTYSNDLTEIFYKRLDFKISDEPKLKFRVRSVAQALRLFSECTNKPFGTLVNTKVCINLNTLKAIISLLLKSENFEAYIIPFDTNDGLKILDKHDSILAVLLGQRC